MVNVVHKFELVDARIFELPQQDNIGATHLATIKWNLREFVYFRVGSTGATYIEEVILTPTYSNGKLTAKFALIEDNELWEALANFLQEKGITDMTRGYKNPFL